MYCIMYIYIYDPTIQPLACGNVCLSGSSAGCRFKPLATNLRPACPGGSSYFPIEMRGDVGATLGKP